MLALLTVFNSWALLETRRLVQVFPEPLRKLWNNWEVRVLVLVSLTLQLCLLHFGSRRRYSDKTWLGVLLWLSYLGADSVATVALGVISNNQGNSYNCNDSQSQNELIAFWAPFLLLHLGGQDTITAYAVQDNELWLRHLLGLVVQSVVALYIFLLSWKVSWLSFLTIPMFVAGFIKYAERIYVLKAANSPHPLIGLPMSGRHAIFHTPNGYLVSSDKHSVGSSEESNNAAETWDVFLLFKVFRYRFLNQRHRIYINDFGLSSYFSDSQTAWKTIEDELGYSYDAYYTKAPLFFTAWGFLLRIISFTSIVLVFVFFLLTERHKHPRIDMVITFLLLVGAVIVEIYAVILLCGCDWPVCGSDRTRNTHGQLIKHFTNVRIGFAKMTSKQKWSKSMGQLSLLGLYFKDKRLQNGQGTPKLFANCREWALKQMLLRLDIRLKMLFYRSNKDVSEYLKKLVHKTLKERFQEKVDSVTKGSRIIGRRTASNVMEDYQWIMVWHIATDLLFDKGCDTWGGDINCQLSKGVSDYTMYILAMCPFEFSTGNVNLCFESFCRWLDSYCHRRNLFRLPKDEFWKTIVADIADPEFDLAGPSKFALHSEFKVNMVRRAVDIAGGVVLDPGMWKEISEFWVEILIYVASLSQGICHVQQLRKGGEFLTHVWLLIESLDLAESIRKSDPANWPRSTILYQKDGLSEDEAFIVSRKL